MTTDSAMERVRFISSQCADTAHHARTRHHASRQCSPTDRSEHPPPNRPGRALRRHWNRDQASDRRPPAAGKPNKPPTIEQERRVRPSIVDRHAPLQPAMPMYQPPRWQPPRKHGLQLPLSRDQLGAIIAYPVLTTVRLGGGVHVVVYAAACAGARRSRPEDSTRHNPTSQAFYLICGFYLPTEYVRGSERKPTNPPQLTITDHSINQQSPPQLPLVLGIYSALVVVGVACWFYVSLTDPAQPVSEPHLHRHLWQMDPIEPMSLAHVPSPPLPTVATWEQGGIACLCMKQTQSHSRYCASCRKSVPGLDHHCLWCVRWLIDPMMSAAWNHVCVIGITSTTYKLHTYTCLSLSPFSPGSTPASARATTFSSSCWPSRVRASTDRCPQPTTSTLPYPPHLNPPPQSPPATNNQ